MQCLKDGLQNGHILAKMLQKPDCRRQMRNEEPSLTIRQVRIIDAVATHASLAKAGEHLNTSQSSLSRYIAEAERVLAHVSSSVDGPAWSRPHRAKS